MMRIFRRSSGGSAVSPSYVGSVVPLHTSPGGEKNQNKTKQEEKDPNSSVFSRPINPFSNVAPHEKEEDRSSLLLPGHLGGVPCSGPDEGLEGSTLRVDAQRHSFALLVLRDEAMD